MPSVVAMPRDSLFRESRPPQLRTVDQFCQEHPAFTPGGIRWLLFHRQSNGLESAVVRVGRRVFIDVERFFTWVDTQNRRVEQEL
jgi:hypothetical protein